MARDVKGQLRRDYFWNSASSLMFSAASVIMTMVISRWLGLAAAGIYGVAIAVGQQFQTLGGYEVRPYQATDVRQRFTFGTYFSTRIITVALMIAGIVGYALITENPIQSALLIIAIASLRVFDAFEDVFYTEFQRQGRLDIAGMTNFFRVLATTLAFCGAVYFTGDLGLSALIALAVTLGGMMVLVIPPAVKMYSIRPSFEWRPIKDLLIACFPLFLSSFLAAYAINAPRFAVQTYLDKVEWGVYTVIFMPAFAINLLTMLVFRPLLTRLALAWAERDTSRFGSLVGEGLKALLLASAVTLVVTYFAGVPILDFLFTKPGEPSIAPYWASLMILVVAGMFNAVGIVFYYSLATVRRQGLILLGYAVTAAVAFFLSLFLVPRMGLLGAAWSFAISMVILAAIFGVTLWIVVRRERDAIACSGPGERADQEPLLAENIDEDLQAGS